MEKNQDIILKTRNRTNLIQRNNKNYYNAMFGTKMKYIFPKIQAQTNFVGPRSTCMKLIKHGC